MDILDDMVVSKLSAKVFFKVNYSFKCYTSVSFFLRWRLLSGKQDQTTLIDARFHLCYIENPTDSRLFEKGQRHVSVKCTFFTSHLSQHIWKMRVKSGRAACFLMIHLTEHAFPLNWVGYSKCHRLLSAM